MYSFFMYLLKPASSQIIEYAILFMRVSLGILTALHGFPKISGGLATWAQLGTFVNPLGIYFWPIFWGFLGAFFEFFGGIAFTLGFFTRFFSLGLTIMMFVATVWHISRKDPFNIYSYPLTLIFIFWAFFIMGGGTYSIDSYISQKLFK